MRTSVHVLHLNGYIQFVIHDLYIRSKMAPRIGFVHPDLGIGGAERLVVDAGIALQSKGYDIEMFTAHHDSTHCFTETRDGTLKVTSAGDWLPRKVCGRLYILCAYMRMMYLAFYVVLFHGSKFDIFICDQVSACIPILKLTGAKVIFYCHFPDKLLTRRDWWMKKWYRKPIDCTEEVTTGMADVILVNSNFTAKVFRDTFKSLKKRTPAVVYPSLNFQSFDVNLPNMDVGIPPEATYVLLSINRYERKKNIVLAIDGLYQLLRQIRPEEFNKVHLVIAGGYDERVTENKEYYNELRAHVIKLGLTDCVTFLRSISHETKLYLLKRSSLLLYTPEKEHFGIVPLEAMYMRTPVIATNSGGPLETVVNGETGYLTNGEAKAYAERLMYFYYRTKEISRMGDVARQRIIEKFSFEVFTEKFHQVVNSLQEKCS